MSDMDQRQLVERIHAGATPMVLAVTGGGSGAFSALLEVPGASATVLEAIVPYSARALDAWLGGVPDNYCSERTARAMAMGAFERARELSDVDPRELRGIGATASLASNRPKRGAHRIHVAWQSAEMTAVTSCELVKGARTRAAEEQVAGRLILNAAARAAGIGGEVSVPLVGDAVSTRVQQAPLAWSELLLGDRSTVKVRGDKLDGAEVPSALFPGAFNPVHAAHWRMAEIAARRLDRPVWFELSITNVDKAPLDFIEIADRLRQFPEHRVLLTRAPRFIEKARLAPQCTFVVGVDTIVRIGDAKYYDGNELARDAAIAALANAGSSFLVFGRVLRGSFATLSNVAIPASLRAICSEVSEAEFREDISSTELRAGGSA